MKNTRLEQLIEFLGKQPEDPFLKYAIATEYLKLGDTGKALDYFIGLVKNHSGYLGTYYHLGKLYERLGSNPKAEETYKKGMAVAREQRNHHALSELLAAYNSVNEAEENDE